MNRVNPGKDNRKGAKSAKEDAKRISSLRLPLRSLRLCGCLLFLVAGCNSERILTYPPMSPEQAMKVLADRSSAIHAISAQGLITLTRENGDNVRLDAAIVLQPPSRARVRAWKFGRAVFDMTLTPEGLWLIAPQESDRRKEIVAAGANIGRLTREWLGLISGAVQGSVASDSDGKLILEFLRDDGSTMLCQIDRKTLTPRRYDLKAGNGIVRFTLKLNRYADIGGVVWPREIEAVSPTGQVLIELHDVEINGEIPDGAFRPPARAEKIESSSPFSGTPGEGWGGGSAELLNPHPSPPPEYRRRGLEAR